MRSWNRQIDNDVDILRIERRGVLIRSAGGTERLINADTVIIAGNPEADTDLADQLVATGLRVEAIGDCTGLGLIAGATRSAADAVARICGEEETG